MGLSYPCADAVAAACARHEQGGREGSTAAPAGFAPTVPPGAGAAAPDDAEAGE